MAVVVGGRKKEKSTMFVEWDEPPLKLIFASLLARVIKVALPRKLRR